MSFLNPRDYFVEVNQGKFAGESTVFSNGDQVSNSAGVEADVWSGVVGNLQWLQSEQAIEVLSSSANDAPAGTGARTVLVSGLDINLDPVSETVALNGTTPVTLANTYFRINRGFVIQTGTYTGSNEGNITFRTVAGAITQAYMPIDYGRIAMTHYTVPNGKRFILQSFSYNAETGKPTDFQFRINASLPVAAPFGTSQIALQTKGIQGAFTRKLEGILTLGAGVDIWVTATPGTNNTKLSADWVAVLVDA